MLRNYFPHALAKRRFLLAALVLAVNAAPVFAQEESVRMCVAERNFAVVLADTDAARAFAALLPLELEMAELNGNEKFAPLPQSLPARAHAPERIEAGDVMLYGADTVAVFYESFRSNYRYTRIGRVRDPHGLARALGRGDVRVRFSPERAQGC